MHGFFYEMVLISGYVHVCMLYFLYIGSYIPSKKQI